MGFKPGFTGTNQVETKRITDLPADEQERIMQYGPAAKKNNELFTTAPKSFASPGGRSRKWLR